jgi:hypothetical protein
MYYIFRFAAGRWFSQGIPLSFTNKTDRQDITEILLNVELNTITLAPKRVFLYFLTILPRDSLLFH